MEQLRVEGVTQVSRPPFHAIPIVLLFVALAGLVSPWLSFLLLLLAGQVGGGYVREGSTTGGSLEVDSGVVRLIASDVDRALFAVATCAMLSWLPIRPERGSWSIAVPSVRAWS